MQSNEVGEHKEKWVKARQQESKMTWIHSSIYSLINEVHASRVKFLYASSHPCFFKVKGNNRSCLELKIRTNACKKEMELKQTGEKVKVNVSHHPYHVVAWIGHYR